MDAPSKWLIDQKSDSITADLICSKAIIFTMADLLCVERIVLEVLEHKYYQIIDRPYNHFRFHSAFRCISFLKSMTVSHSIFSITTVTV